MLLYLPSQIRSPIGGERVTCHGSKLTNSLGRTKLTNSLGKQQLELSTRTWSGRAPWNHLVAYLCKFVQNFYNLFYFWVGRYNKSLNDWSFGKQLILFSPNLNVWDSRETKLTVSLGTSHFKSVYYRQNWPKSSEDRLRQCLRQWRSWLTGTRPYYPFFIQ